jgi:DNA-binding NarL/FixJ family response regulator
VILLASDNIDILSKWGAMLRNLHQISVAASLDELKNKLTLSSPDCVALDHALAPQNLLEAVKQIRSANHQTKIVLLTEPGFQHSDQEILALLKAGIRGFCPYDTNAELISKVLGALEQGQVWVRSSFIPTLIDELSKKTKNSISTPHNASGEYPDETDSGYQSLLTELTPREKEVAILVGQGECNKRIAQCLEISEQTVKAHLTTIFRKLNVTDRVRLALLVTHPPLP